MDIFELRDAARAADLANRAVPAIDADVIDAWEDQTRRALDAGMQAATVRSMTDRRGMWACPTCDDGLRTIDSPVQCRQCILAHRGWEV